MSSRKQLLIPLLLIVVALLLSSLPFLYGWIHEKPGFEYTGMRGLNASDYNVNLSWIEQGRRGNVLFRNLYAFESDKGFLIRPIYFLISVPFGLISISNGAVYHIQRTLCGLVLLAALFPLLRRFIPEPRIVTIAFALMAFTSGLGFLFRDVLSHPLDLAVPEAVLFLSLGEAPHFLYSQLLLWTGVAGFYTITLEGRRRFRPDPDPEHTGGRQNLSSNGLSGLILPLICLFFLWWEHPFDALTLSAIGAVSSLLLPQWKQRILLIAAVALTGAGPMAYYLHIATFPEFAGWAAQNILITPPPSSILSAFAPLMILSVPGALILRSTDRSKLLTFLLLWIAVHLLLAYLPFSFQRRSIAGIQFPLAILAATGLSSLRKTLLTTTIVVILASGNLWFTWQQIGDLRTVRMPFYLPDSYDDAFRWLRTQEPGVVLSGYVTGNFIPALTGFPVYVGHSIQTPRIDQRKQETADFYANPQREFLQKYRIRYIFWGQEERPFSGPGFENEFDPVYNGNGIRIFAVRP